MAEKNGKVSKTIWWLMLGYALAALLGAGLASVWWHQHNQRTIRVISAQIKPLRQANNPFLYINPLLGYEIPGDIKEFNEYKPLKAKINQVVSQTQNPNLNSFSVYFRDLTLGRWTGINENAAYYPGSMMKVAVMITYFKAAETNPAVLQQKLQYSSSTADQINGVPFSAPSELQVGKSYSAEQLIEAMIIHSDNGAKDVLINNIDQNNFIEVHTDLGLSNPATADNYTITAKEYALLLRVLYNATYLSRDYSEKALQILSRADYNQGLTAGVPQSTTVAQKYGEALDTTTNRGQPVISLSDCGIVYHPSHPYILCVMTSGNNIDDLAKTIATISGIVWNQVNAYAISQNH